MLLLEDPIFAGVIAATPLVSIDLIVWNKSAEVLLGKRQNRPAMGYWFVPGGRIRKNERLRDALKRIALGELGFTATAGKLLGAFDHFYDDNTFGTPGFGTHYVALGYELKMSADTPIIQDAQHTEFKWWNVDALLLSDAVHPNTKLYFSDTAQ